MPLACLYSIANPEQAGSMFYSTVRREDEAMGGVVGDVEALRREILKQAQEQAAKTLDRVQRVSERDLAYAREEAEEIRSQQRAAVQPMAEIEKRKAAAAAEMEARRKLLEKKEELVSRIFAEAEGGLERLRGSEAYMDIISKLIEEGIASIGGDAIVEFGEKDKGIFTPEAISSVESHVAGSLGAEAQLQFRCAGDNISAGVVVRSKDGRVIIDNSFSGRLKRLKEELRGKVSEMLLQE
jgi:vacuolar-type H+-ATPase subunit E/Vma4